jgi:membrane-associated phospholipid phosphatase
MKTKNLLLATACTLAIAPTYAKTIPVCKSLNTGATEVSESLSELMTQAEKLSARGKHCKAARKLQLSFFKDQEAALANGVDIKLLENLEKGKFLNDFMTFSLALKKMNKNHPQAEYMDYMLTQAYVKNLPKNAELSPIGNFIKPDGTPMGLVTEAKLVQKNFLVKYPNSKHSVKVESDNLRTQEVALAQAVANFNTEYRSIKRSKDIELLTFHASNLAKEMQANSSDEQRAQALYSLFKLYKDKRSLILGADQKIAEIHNLLITDYPNKKFAKKVARFMKRKKISSKTNASMEVFTNQLISESTLDKKLLNDKDLKSLIQRKKGNDKSIFLPLSVTDKEKQIILRTLGVVGVLMAFDRPLMDFVQNNRSDTLGQIVDITNSFGEETGLLPLVGSSMALGLVFKNDKLKRAAIRSLGAVAIGQLTVEFLKAMTHRSRPRNNQGPYHFEGPDWQSDNTSFPSGHSAGAWSVMTVFATEFKDTKIVPILAYGLAAMTSFSRVYKNAHWVSDVTLGALVGWISGKLMYKLFKTKPSGKFTVTPVMGDMNGGAVTIRTEGQQELKAWPIDYYNMVNNQ